MIHTREHGKAKVSLDDVAATVTVEVDGTTKVQRAQVRISLYHLFDAIDTEAKAIAWEPYSEEPTDEHPQGEPIPKTLR